MVDEHISNLTITQEEIQETERLTRRQKKNSLWFEKRKTLLTASNFGKAGKTKVEPSNKLKSILYSNFTTDALQYGIECGPKAVKLYIKEMRKNGVNVKGEEVGLLMSKEKPYLELALTELSPSKIQKKKWGMEIKSPFSKAAMTVEEACKTKNFFLEKLGDGTVRLKQNHDYYLQIQGQLYCSDLDLQGIILTVYFGEDKPLFLENIYSDNTWSSDCLPKIDFFYPGRAIRHYFLCMLIFIYSGLSDTTFFAH